MVQIRQQLVQNPTKLYTGTNPGEFITVHETANVSVGANAAAHANLQSKDNVRNASWQYQVDDIEVVQSFPDTAQCWHAGDGKGPGNLRSLALEICVNADGNFVKAVTNAAALTAQLRAKHGTPMDNVVQHERWSKKNCPTLLRSGAHGVTWNDFLEMVAGGPSTPPPAPAGQVVLAPGVRAPAFPLPSGWYFGPKSGPKQSVSGFYGYRGYLRAWQQRMSDRGWVINPDGFYGPQTANIARLFQIEKGLTVDELIGSETWAAAWTAPVTRG